MSDMNVQNVSIKACLQYSYLLTREMPLARDSRKIYSMPPLNSPLALTSYLLVALALTVLTSLLALLSLLLFLSYLLSCPSSLCVHVSTREQL
jgi:hypothetical protein